MNLEGQRPFAVTANRRAGYSIHWLRGYQPHPADPFSLAAWCILLREEPVNRRRMELPLADIAQGGVLRADHSLLAQPGGDRAAAPCAPSGRVPMRVDEALALKGRQVRMTSADARAQHGDSGQSESAACAKLPLTSGALLPLDDEPNHAEQAT
jgi:hypothetical protein